MSALNTTNLKNIINKNTIMALIDEAIKELMYGFADEAWYIVPDDTLPETALEIQELLKALGYTVVCNGNAYSISIPETPNEDNWVPGIIDAFAAQDVRLTVCDFDWYQNLIDNMVSKSTTVMFSDLPTLGPKQRGCLGIVPAYKFQSAGFVWYMEKNGFKVETLNDRFMITYAS